MFLIVLINFIFESTLLQYFAILGVMPNTSLILIICFAVLGGKKIGGSLGIILGLLEDAFFYNVIGVHALIYFIIGYSIGIVEKKVFKENLFLPLLFTFISTIGFHVIYFVFMYFLSIDVSFIKLMKEVVIVEALYNSVLSVFFYKQILKLYRQPHISFRKK